MLRTDRWRPVVPAGVSVSHPKITAGTLGCYLWLNGKAYIISNNHIIADFGQGKIGDDIIQPGSFDGGEDPQDTIAHLSWFSPYNKIGPNKLDIATAEVLPQYIDDRIIDLQAGAQLASVSPADARLGERVVKSGRTTGITVGQVANTSVAVSVGGFPWGVLIFEDCLLIEGLCQGGDSGSAVIGIDTGNLVGLLFAGSDNEYYAIKISNIIRALGQQPQFRTLAVSPVSEAQWFVPVIGGILGLVVLGMVISGGGHK